MDDFHTFELPPLNIRGIESRDAPGELRAVQIANAHHFAGLELAFATGDTWRQKAFPIFPKCFLCPRVNVQRALCMMKKSYPPLPASQPSGLGDKEGPLLLAGQNPGKCLLLFACGNDEGNAGTDSNLGSLDL